jgi:hypothetical protein
MAIPGSVNDPLQDFMTFSDDLYRFGPDTSNRVDREEALAYCARLTATHYENFSVVTWLTPCEHRPAFQSIYAFCRSNCCRGGVGSYERCTRGRPATPS